MKFALLVISVCFSLPLYAADAPQVIEGLIDLTDWNFKKDGPVNLTGDYEFYWKEQLTTTDLYVRPVSTLSYMHVPGAWNGAEIDGEELQGSGYATYRVNILVGTLTPFALKVPDLGTSYRLIVDGTEVYTAGNPGKNKESTTPRYSPAVISFTPSSYRIEIILQISNFHHRLGGAWLSIFFGTPDQLSGLRESQLARDLALFGAIFIIGLYNLALFALRRENTSHLYLGLFCVLLAARVLLVGDRYFASLFPGMPFEWYVRLEYLTWFLAASVFSGFLYTIFPQEFKKITILIVHGIFGLGSLITLLAPVSISSEIIPLFQLVTIACLIYGTYALVMAIRHRRDGALILLFAYVFLFYTVVSDILSNNGFIENVLLFDVGLFVFIFCQSILISYRFTRSFKTIEKQRELLQATTIRLQTQQKLRREAEQESESLQGRIVRSEKMEAIGLLAGGVAHDLNNILSNTVTYPELALLDLSKDDPLYKPLEMTRLAGIRAAAVIQDLLTLARRGVISREVIDLNKLIAEHLSSIEHETMLPEEKNISIETFLDGDLYHIEASPVHLQKLLMNLISNSIDSIEHEGKILITTHNESIEAKSLFYGELKAGDYAVLGVEDSGSGIDPHDLDKIFEPFHTTKVMGQSGTGLGMSVVWGVVQDHQGAIDVMSLPGDGTRFDIYLPRTNETISEQPRSMPFKDLMGTGEAVLVVDDQIDQRNLTREVLTRLNYIPTVCATGREAVKLATEKYYDLVLLDMVMDGGWDGPQTFLELQKIRPDQKIILVSGFADIEKIKEASDIGATAFVKKPFTLESIGRAIRNAIRR